MSKQFLRTTDPQFRERARQSFGTEREFLDALPSAEFIEQIVTSLFEKLLLRKERFISMRFVSCLTHYWK